MTLGKVASAVSSTHIAIRPWPAGKIHPGMYLVFASPSGVRAGFAYVHSVTEVDGGWVGFRYPVNVAVPAIAKGDEVQEYVQPCTRCCCVACEQERARWWGPR